MEKMELSFGTGKYMVADTFQEDKSGVGVCVYKNQNPNPSLGQTDIGSHGKNTDEVDAILRLEFSNVESIDVWIRAFERAKIALLEME